MGMPTFFKQIAIHTPQERATWHEARERAAREHDGGIRSLILRLLAHYVEVGLPAILAARPARGARTAEPIDWNAPMVEITDDDAVYEEP